MQELKENVDVSKWHVIDAEKEKLQHIGIKVSLT